MSTSSAQPTVVFLHGTSVRDGKPFQDSIALIERRLREIDGRGDLTFLPILWGDAVGPDLLDLSPTLPPEDDDGDDITGRWDALLADPLWQLEVLEPDSSSERAGAPTPAGGLFDGTTAMQIVQRVAGAEPPLAELHHAGFDVADFTAARDALAGEKALAKAGKRVGDPTDPTLVAAAASALVAYMLIARRKAGRPVLATYDGEARNALARAVGHAISPAPTRGIVKQFAGTLTTKLLKTTRARTVEAFGKFARDILWYESHSAEAHDYIAKIVAEEAPDGPLVILGHSLGGILAVDLLATPGPESDEVISPARAALVARTKLLVTAGSQSPVVYLCDGLRSLRPADAAGTPAQGTPFTPWLNFYDHDDFLSFRAAEVFGAGIVDVPVRSGVPFMESHSAYWMQDEFYALVAQELDRRGL